MQSTGLPASWINLTNFNIPTAASAQFVLPLRSCSSYRATKEALAMSSKPVASIAL